MRRCIPRRCDGGAETARRGNHLGMGRLVGRTAFRDRGVCTFGRQVNRQSRAVGRRPTMSWRGTLGCTPHAEHGSGEEETARPSPARAAPRPGYLDRSPSSVTRIDGAAVKRVRQIDAGYLGAGNPSVVGGGTGRSWGLFAVLRDLPRLCSAPSPTPSPDNGKHGRRCSSAVRRLPAPCTTLPQETG